MFRNLFDSLRDALSSLSGGLFGTPQEPEQPLPREPEEPSFLDNLGKSFADTFGFGEEEEPESEVLDSLWEDALDHAMHPIEAREYFENDGIYLTDSEMDDYRDDLIDRYNFSLENDDSNWTEREIYGSYAELIDYLSTFNGGYPDEDIIDIVLTEEGYQLYVEINSA